MAYECYIARTPDQILAYPHHTRMDIWGTARLIYGEKQKTDQGNYSDRLWEWDYNAGDRASAACNKQGLTRRTARQWEAWLSTYHDRPITLVYIMAGSNHATGYDYYYLGYNWL